jgi:type III secretory pathway component EscV
MKTEQTPSLTLYLGRLPGIDRKILKSELERFQELFFDECGLVIPIYVLKEDDTLPENAFQPEINGEKQAAIEGLAENEFWVYYPYSDITQPLFDRTWQARPSVEPNSGGEAAIVVGGDAELQIWNENGYDIRTRQGYIPFQVAAQVRTRKADFLTPTLVRYSLSQLMESYPDLVAVARQVLSEEELVLELKSRLEAELSIKNLPGILEELLAGKVSPETLQY